MRSVSLWLICGAEQPGSSGLFGIMICLDSHFPDVAHALVSRGAQALFVPSNNGMPESRSDETLVADARRVDIA